MGGGGGGPSDRKFQTPLVDKFTFENQQVSRQLFSEWLGGPHNFPKTPFALHEFKFRMESIFVNHKNSHSRKGGKLFVPSRSFLTSLYIPWHADRRVVHPRLRRRCIDLLGFLLRSSPLILRFASLRIVHFKLAFFFFFFFFFF